MIHELRMDQVICEIEVTVTVDLRKSMPGESLVLFAHPYPTIRWEPILRVYARHADQNQCDVVAVVVVAQQFQGGEAEPFYGCVDLRVRVGAVRGL